MNITGLNTMDMFSTLNTSELDKVRRLMRRHRISKGWVLFREKDVGNLMYIILSGTVAVSVRSEDGSEVEVGQVSDGSFFGEMSILEKDVRSATCKTETDCILLSLDGRSFQTLMDKEPETANKIMKQMLHTAAKRLEDTGAFLSDMVKWGEEARLRAVTDEFTGFYNRRYFDDALKDAVFKTGLENYIFSLVIIDLDRFGTLNAEYGEETGDLVILESSKIFRKTFMQTDILSRYGGDEFAFILPETDGKSAFERCTQAVKAIRSITVLKDLKGSFKNVSCTMGIAECPLHSQTTTTLMEQADSALYKAKKEGRDRAILYTPSGRKKK